MGIRLGTRVILALLLAVSLSTAAAAQTSLYSITADALVDAGGNPVTFLKRIDPASGQTLASVPITLVNPPPPISPDDHVVSGNGLAAHPQTGQLLAVLTLQSDVNPHPNKRHLAIVDPVTGEATVLRDIGHFAGLAFTTGGALGTGTLLGVTGDGAGGNFCPPQPQCAGATLYQLLDNGQVTLLKNFLTLTSGEAIAFNPVNLLLYHTSGGGNSRLFESVNLSNPSGPTTRIALNGAASAQLTALTYSQAFFLAADGNNDFFTINPSFGVISKIGTLDHKSKGLAFVAPPPPPPTTVVASVLPSSRAVQIPGPATAFATVVNAGVNLALSVGIQLAAAPAVLATLTYNTTDCVTNAVTGGANSPANIAPGGKACYVISLAPSAPLEPLEAAFVFQGVNTPPAPTLPGIDTLLLSASDTPVPDPVALAVTATGDGILHVPGPAGSAAFAMAVANVGAGDFLTVLANTGAVALPALLTVCQTVPATGACLAAPAPSVTTFVGAGTTPTFAIFVKATGAIPADAAANRIFVLLNDAGDATRGRTSVAVQTE